MANDVMKVDETYSAYDKTKQFILLPTFENFAKSKGHNEKSIAQAKEEIAKRFGQFNAEGMNDQRFKILSRTISNMVESELSRAKSKLQEQSGAMVGIEPMTIPTDMQPPNSLPIATVQKSNDKINLGTTIRAINTRKEVLASL